MIFKNAMILSDGKTKIADIQTDGQKIVKIGENLSGEGYDLKGAFVTGGAVDPHAHFRQPGYEAKETIKTGSLSAAKGGVFTAFAMPNLNPVPDSEENLQKEIELIKKDAEITVLPFGAVTKGQQGRQLADIASIADKVVAFSDDGRCVNDTGLLLEAMQEVKKTGKIICSHAEAAGYGDSEQAEYIAVERELGLVKKSKVKYHFCHLSTAESFDLVRGAKADGLDVTCEVTPHHISLSASDKTDANFKMNPPLRQKKDVEAARVALLDGTADMIATDHAPHTEYEKSLPWDKAPYGIIGFETLYPVVITSLYKTGYISLEALVRFTRIGAKNRFGIQTGEIKEGEAATFCALDIQNKRPYKKSEILSGGKNSPYIGMDLYGFNLLSVINGKIKYIDTEALCQTKF